MQWAQRDGFSTSWTRASITSWWKWLYLYAWIAIASDLTGVSNHIPYLQVCSDRVRVSVLVANSSGVKNRNVEGYLRNVGQVFSDVGSKDPRLDGLGEIDFCLSKQICAYSQEDPPTDRVRPILISLLYECWRHLHNGYDQQQTITDLLYLGFLLLCRPREYCKGGKDMCLSTFRLADIIFFVNSRRLRASDAPLSDLRLANFVSLTLNYQKNTFRGESIGHGSSGHQYDCTMCRILYRVEYLSSQGASPNPPLCAFKSVQILAQCHQRSSRVDPPRHLKQLGRVPGLTS